MSTDREVATITSGEYGGTDYGPDESRSFYRLRIGDWKYEFKYEFEARNLKNAIATALAAKGEASRVEERAAVVAWLRTSWLMSDHPRPHDIADAIERLDHLTPEKGDG